MLSVLGGPLGGGGLPLAVTALPDLSDGHLLRILGIGRLQHSQDGFDHKLSVQGGNPVLVDRLCADFTSVGLHARVVNLGHELDLGWLEGVVVGEVQVHLEVAADEGSSLGSIKHNIPDGNVVLRGVNGHAWDWGTRQVAQFLLHNKRDHVKNQILYDTAKCQVMSHSSQCLLPFFT